MWTVLGLALLGIVLGQVSSAACQAGRADLKEGSLNGTGGCMVALVAMAIALLGTFCIFWAGVTFGRLP